LIAISCSIEKKIGIVAKKKIMLIFTLATLSVLAPDFKVNTLTCVDKGLYQRYCPLQAYPHFNSGFVPVRSNLRVKSGELVPRTRREMNDAIGLRFVYEVVCETHNWRYQCTKGAVTINVHPTMKWDKPISWWHFVIDIIMFIIIVTIGGPIAAILCVLFLDTTPMFKRTSFSSDD